jgi:alkylation response protein AidB-like acyl-CoA dehydrogenase
MDFRLSEDQETLQGAVRAFCERRVPPESLGDLAKAPVTRALWSELAELGVFALREPESRGGVGLGMADAVLVFAELGRRLVPGPLVWSHLAAPLVPGAASGECIVGGLDLWRASSDPLLVEHRDALDALLVLRADGVFRVDPRGLASHPVTTPLDPLTPVHHAHALPAGERVTDAGAAARMRSEGAALVAALQLGVAEAALELACEWAKRREQFGRPIGSFQALKHLMADMLVRKEQARCAVWAAGATLDDPSVGDAARSVSVAKAMAGEAALRNARACIQIHGGMGYTWEMPPHFHLKRALVLENVFGTTDEHCEAVAERLADSPGTHATQK